jgi:hypothetical protein
MELFASPRRGLKKLISLNLGQAKFNYFACPYFYSLIFVSFLYLLLSCFSFFIDFYVNTLYPYLETQYALRFTQRANDKRP